MSQVEELKQLWTYEYGGVLKRSWWSKTKLVFTTLWFLPLVFFYAILTLLTMEKE